MMNTNIGVVHYVREYSGMRLLTQEDGNPIDRHYKIYDATRWRLNFIEDLRDQK